MKTFALRVVISFLAIAALWVVVTATLWYCVEVIFGARVADGFFPFLNAHIVEDVAKGTYSPLSDPPFLIRVCLLAIVPFGVVTHLAARNVAPRRRWLALLPTLFALAILGWILSFAWGHQYPKSLRVGAVAELAAYLAASCVGWLLAAYRRTPPASG